MRKFIWFGVASIAVFAFVAVAKAQDVGFENIFGDIVSVDLKVNGQDGSVKVDKGERIVVSWVSDGATRCRGNWSKNDIKLSGTIAGKISKSAIIKIACIDGQGGRDDDSVVVNVSGGAVIGQPTTGTTTAQPTITVLSPNGGEIYKQGDTVPIRWSSNNIKSQYLRIGLVDLKNKDVNPSRIEPNAINDKGVFSWTVSGGFATGQYKVIISDPNDFSVNDESNDYFTITAPTTGNVGTGNVGTAAQPTISYIQAKAEDKNIMHAGESVVIYGANLNTVGSLYVRILGKAYEQDVAVSNVLDGSAYFNVPSNISNGDYDIYLIYKAGQSNTLRVRGVSAPTTAQPTIRVLSPNGGERISAGSIYTIKWNDTGTSSRVFITLYANNTQRVIDSGMGIDTSVPNSGSFVWRVPITLDELRSTPIDKDYSVYIAIRDAQNEKIVGRSQNFTITATTTISPISVDLKIDGGTGFSDGPITVSAGKTIALSYKTTGKIAECKGDVSGYESASNRVVANATRTYTVTCSQDGGTGTASDSVTVNVEAATTSTPPTATSGTPTITVTGPPNSLGAPQRAGVTFTSSGVSNVKIEACVNKTDCTILTVSTPVTSVMSSYGWSWEIVGNEPFVGAFGTKPIYLKVTDVASGVFDFTDSYIYVTPPVSGSAESNLAGASVPGTDVWEFLKSFFGR